MDYEELSRWGSRTAVVELDPKTRRAKLTRKPENPKELVVRLTERDLSRDSNGTGFEPFWHLQFCMWLTSPCFPEKCPPDLGDVVDCLDSDEESLRRRFRSG